MSNDKRQNKPSYEDLVYALKETHKLYIEAVRHSYMTHDITRIMSNENIIERVEEND